MNEQNITILDSIDFPPHPYCACRCGCVSHTLHEKTFQPSVLVLLFIQSRYSTNLRNIGSQISLSYTTASNSSWKDELQLMGLLRVSFQLGMPSASK